MFTFTKHTSRLFQEVDVMKREDIEKILRFLRTQKTHRDFVFLKILLETDLTLTEILSLKIADVKDKSAILDNDKKAYPITLDLKREIKEYLEFLTDENAFLFKGTKENSPITRIRAWGILKEPFEELGLDKSYKDFKKLREIYRHF